MAWCKVGNKPVNIEMLSSVEKEQSCNFKKILLVVKQSARRLRLSITDQQGCLIMFERILTTVEAAVVLLLQPQTIRARRHHKGAEKPRPIRLGRWAIRYSERELEAWLQRWRQSNS